MRSHMLRRLVPLLVSLAAISCSDPASPKNELLGTYLLETVSGQSLPYILEQSATRKVELTGETVTLLAANRQTMVTSFRVTDNGVVTLENVPAPGNYTANGST